MMFVVLFYFSATATCCCHCYLLPAVLRDAVLMALPVMMRYICFVEPMADGEGTVDGCDGLIADRRQHRRDSNA